MHRHGTDSATHQQHGAPRGRQQESRASMVSGRGQPWQQCDQVRCRSRRCRSCRRARPWSDAWPRLTGTLGSFAHSIHGHFMRGVGVAKVTKSLARQECHPLYPSLPGPFDLGGWGPSRGFVPPHPRAHTTEHGCGKAAEANEIPINQMQPEGKAFVKRARPRRSRAACRRPGARGG